VVLLFYYVENSTKQKIEIIRSQTHKSLKFEGSHSTNQLKESIRTLSEQEKIIENSTISSVKVLDFIRMIELSAENKGLKIIIEKVEPGEEQPLDNQNKTISETFFTIQAKGQYDSVFLFVEELLQNEKKLTLNQINLYRSEDAGQIEYTVRMKLRGIILK
jgi:hypothetical protein